MAAPRPVPRRLHPDSSLSPSSLDYWRKQTTDNILESLRPKPGNAEPIVIKSDGTILQGNTRVKVLEERGYDLDGCGNISRRAGPVKAPVA